MILLPDTLFRHMIIDAEIHTPTRKFSPDAADAMPHVTPCHVTAHVLIIRNNRFDMSLVSRHTPPPAALMSLRPRRRLQHADTLLLLLRAPPRADAARCHAADEAAR